jgi:hypothetical protein
VAGFCSAVDTELRIFLRYRAVIVEAPDVGSTRTTSTFLKRYYLSALHKHLAERGMAVIVSQEDHPFSFKRIGNAVGSGTVAAHSTQGWGGFGPSAMQLVFGIKHCCQGRAAAAVEDESYFVAMG